MFASGVRSVDEGPPDWRYGAGQSLSLIGVGVAGSKSREAWRTGLHSQLHALLSSSRS